MKIVEKLSSAEVETLEFRIRARAGQKTREELIEYFRELCGPHVDPDVEALSTAEFIEAYVVAELERLLDPDNGLGANLDKLCEGL